MWTQYEYQVREYMRIRACAQTRQGQCEKNGSAACAQRKKMFMLEAACEGDMSSVSGAGAPVQGEWA